MNDSYRLGCSSVERISLRDRSIGDWKGDEMTVQKAKLDCVKADKAPNRNPTNFVDRLMGRVGNVRSQ
jgi:hypothetical protein